MSIEAYWGYLVLDEAIIKASLSGEVRLRYESQNWLIDLKAEQNNSLLVRGTGVLVGLVFYVANA
jgi:hypothetical protein